jgi:hypothetical protein
VFKLHRNTDAGKSLLKRRAWFDETGASTVTPVIQGDAVEHQVSAVPNPVVTAPVITEDAIKNHPLYKQILSETIERRKEIKQLQEKLASASPAQETTVQTPAPTGRGEITAETVNELVNKRLNEVRLKADQDNLLTQYKVPVEEQEIWRDSNIDNMTKRLQAAFGRPQNGSAGNGSSGGDPFADLAVRIKAGVTGTGVNVGQTLYTPESMTRLGGGVVNN